ncbi:MAG: pyridoxal-phosphate dependent enzyme [Candidatus Latescibacterota bacterium]|nr:pyridoxal-phosphate dependent enzyme [Candidatus Latescibacterota bacterium]
MSSPAYTVDQLRQRLGRLPRLHLAALPTPLDGLARFSEALGGPHILMKREDLTGLAMGGNKIREFEYSLAQGVADGCDVLVHGAAAQSNQSRTTAAVAAKLGLRSLMVGRADAHAHPQGNLLLSHLFGAEIHLPEEGQQRATLERRMQELRAEGHRPLNTSTDGNEFRGIAYVDGFLELYEQLSECEVEPTAVYLCSGQHTHAGMVVAARALGLSLRFVGISPSPRDDAEAARAQLALGRRHCEILNIEVKLSEADFESSAAFVGENYGVITEGSREAIQLLARTEGLLLDPCYTGKAMSGLIAHIREGRWGRDDTVIFVHTGGTPALFAYSNELGLEFVEPNR